MIAKKMHTGLQIVNLQFVCIAFLF